MSFKKTKLKIIPSVNTIDITEFIKVNSNIEWNEAVRIFQNEFNHIQNKLPNEIEMEDEYRISKVIVSKLKYDGWIKKFTDTQKIKKDYYILFTD